MIDRGAEDAGIERIGILGGGQLALMLADAARRAGLRPLIMATSAREPAVLAGHEAVVGKLDDPGDLDGFLARVDVVTIENEFIDLPRLRAALERRPGVRLRPGFAAIGLAQDKLAQKTLFARLGIRSADFEILEDDEGRTGVERLARRFPEGFVLKWSRFGYDGRGNLLVDPARLPTPEEIEDFLHAGRARGAKIYAERRIDFVAELAMVAARGLDGTQTRLPLVETRQEGGVCRELRGPAAAFGFDAALEGEAGEVLARLGAELDFCGAFAVEFFLDRDGGLLINEMAPRVHNSGHYSLWRDDVSQFDLHVLAVTGRPAPAPRGAGMRLMRNVLGPADRPGRLPCPAPVEAPPPGVVLHWYGKDEAAPGRKMGHLTGRAESSEEAARILAAMTDWEARFWASTNGMQESRHEARERGEGRDHHGVRVGPSGHERGVRGAR